jgi:AAHS family 4-hydroxybenzoate transporter-like MFS transporter
MGMGFSGVFTLLMVPAVLASAAIFLMGLRYSRSLQQTSIVVH